MPPEQLQKLTHYKNVLQRMMPYLIAPKGSLPKEFKQDKVEAFEKQIVSIMETFKRRKQPQQAQQQGNLGQQVQAVPQPQQASQILQPDNKPVQQQTPQMNSAPTEMQSNNAASTSFPFLQSNVSSLQQAMGVATQPTPLNSLANASANALHQGNIAAFGQNNVNPLQMNVPGMQQQQDQQFHQSRLLKDQEQSKQLQVRHLPQQQQQQLQKQQQAQLLQGQQAQLQPMTTETSGDSKMAKHVALMKQMFHPHQQVNQRTILQQLQQQQQQQKGPSLQAASSPQMSPASQLSPQSELQNMTNPSLLVPKVGTPLQASTPPYMMASPSPMLEDSESKPLTPAVPTVAPAASGLISHSAVATPSGPSAAIGTPGMSVSPLLGDYTPSPQILNLQDRSQTYLHGTAEDRQVVTEPPMKRLVRAVRFLTFSLRIFLMSVIS